MADGESRTRIDRWLWAARFYKTRSLAAQAVDGGKVHVNGERAKPAKALKVGDAVSIRIGPYEWNIGVTLISHRRGSASEAAKLYAESAESRKAREETAQRIKGDRQSNPFPAGRPTKRQRRQIIRFERKQD